MKKKLLTAGVDEVGRGCLAGPVVSAAVIFKKKINLKNIKDSKKLSFKQRFEISKEIKKNCFFSIGIASVIHHIAIHAVDARIALALGFRPSGWKKNKIRMNANGPEIKPTFFGLVYIFDL